MEEMAKIESKAKSSRWAIKYLGLRVRATNLHPLFKDIDFLPKPLWVSTHLELYRLRNLVLRGISQN